MKLRHLAVAVAACILATGLASSAWGASQSRPFFALLSGKNEIGQDGKKRAGDLDGRGIAIAILRENRLCFAILVEGIAKPTAAHIHRGGRKMNGPVVVPLTPPSDGDPGASSGCVDLEGDLARALAKRPRDFYVNVHNAEFPGGAVRGQLSGRKRK